MPPMTYYIKTYFYLIFVVVFAGSCANVIYPDRSQFQKDGEPVPTVTLNKYKSVQERPEQNEKVAVALSISGGGSRAANLGVGIMLGLEQLKLSNTRNALQEIDYISTVSGGGFAGGSYIGALYNHYYYNRSIEFKLSDYWKTNIQEHLAHSYVSDLVKANFHPWYWFTFIDDGDALEKAIDDHVLFYKYRNSKNKKLPKDERKKNRSITLGDLFIDKDSINKKVIFPMMVANGSTLDKMAIFPFAPDVMEDYQIAGYSHRLKNIKNKNKMNPYELPLAVGIKASGSFPVLISNTTLMSHYHPERKYLHVIDGAMTDNLGYETAMDILKQDDAVKSKVLFIVDADNAGMRPTFSKKQNAAFSMKVYGRLASSGLDARRNTLTKELLSVGKETGIVPIYFSFNVLIEGNEAVPPPSIDVDEQAPRMIAKMKEDMDALTPLDMQVLYELVTNVGTKYTIEDYEQELLILTGQKIVRMKQDEIIKVLTK